MPRSHGRRSHASHVYSCFVVGLCIWRLCLWSAIGFAQNASAPPVLVIDVRAAEGIVVSQLVDALEADLGRAVTQTPQSTPPMLIVEAEPGQVIVIRFRTGDGERSRRVTPEGTPEERTLTIALLASNLVRNESEQLLRMLRPPEEEHDEHNEESAVAVQSEPLDVVVVGETSPPTTPAPKQTPERTSAIRTSFIGVDMLPFVGTSSVFLGRERRVLSLGLIGALAGEVKGIALSSVFDLTLGDVSGLQVSGVGAWSHGAVEGVQVAGVLSFARKRMDGIQFGGVAAMSLDDIVGAQLAGALAYAGDVRGVQASGVLNLARDLTGIQTSTLNISRGRVEGLQLGVGNYAVDVDGAQIGIVNVARGRVRGVQFGLVNITRRSSASIGLVSIHQRGRTQLRFGGDSSGFLSASVIHGSGIIHNVYSVAVNPFEEFTPVAIGWGLGLRARLSSRFHLDFDLLGHLLVEDKRDGFFSALVEPRALLGVRLIGALGIYAAASYQLRISRSPTDVYGPFGRVLREATPNQNQVAGWPAISIGVQIF